MNSYIILSILFISLGSVQAFQLQYGQWEHCYDEPATELVDVHSIGFLIGQTQNHHLGFKLNVDVTMNEALKDPEVNVRLWHAQTGDRYKYGSHNACCDLFFDVQSDECNSGCTIEGKHSGQFERLFAEEVAGDYEAQIQLLDPLAEGEKELMCVYIPFTLSEEFLTQFQQERQEKLEQVKEQQASHLL